MSKPELGIKRDCPECGARFYDLNKEPAHCPKCAHDFVPESLLKPRKTRAEEDPAKKETDETAKPAQETTLENADEEKKAPESKRAAALDEDESEKEEDDELGALGDLDVDLDDDDDDDDEATKGLLDDDNEDEDVSSIVKPTGDDD